MVDDVWTEDMKHWHQVLETRIDKAGRPFNGLSSSFGCPGSSFQKFLRMMSKFNSVSTTQKRRPVVAALLSRIQQEQLQQYEYFIYHHRYGGG
jgi:hypothetical protein